MDDVTLEDRLVLLEKRHTRLRSRAGKLQEELIDIHRDMAEVKLALFKEPAMMPGM